MKDQILQEQNLSIKMRYGLLAFVVLVSSSCTQAIVNSAQQRHPITDRQGFQLTRKDVKTPERFECHVGIHRTKGLAEETQERMHDWENNQRGRGANGGGNLVHHRHSKSSAIAVSSRSQILAMVATMPLHLAMIFVLPL